jgi:hypothetical protein
VDGLVDVDSGSITCNGTSTITAYGFQTTNNPPGFPSCAQGGPGSTAPSESDPLAPFLPKPFPEPAVKNPSPIDGVCQPGEYTGSFNCSVLAPGVYALDQGLSLAGQNTLTEQDGANGGVLLYLPCNTVDGWGTCNAQISIAGGASLSLPPLTIAQSQALFGTNALAGLWLWQNAGDTQAASIVGNGGPQTTLGTAYLPGATVTVNGTSGAALGRLIANTVNLTGNGGVTITGR